MSVPSRKEYLTCHIPEIILATCSLLLIVIFNRSSSPVNLSSGYDESIFKLFGLAIARGRVPYLDYIDRKGPYLFFINAIPYLTHTGRFGLFLLQTCALYAVSLCCFKIAAQYTSCKNALLATLGMYVFYIIFYAEGGQCEDYNLFFSTLALFLYITWLGKKKSVQETPLLYTFIYGICFGCIAFIRINDTAAICSIILVHTVWFCKEKRITLLAKHAAVFLGGLVLASLPALIYFGSHHALADMLYWTFVEGFSYNSHASLFSAFSYRLARFIPLFIACVLSLPHDHAHGTRFFPLIATATALLFLTIGRNNFPHYFIMTLPFYVIAFALLLNEKNYVALGAIFVFFFMPTLSGDSRDPGFFSMLKRAKSELSATPRLVAFQHEAKTLFQTIPPEERDRIFAWNIFAGMGFYPLNHALPPNKSFVFNAASDLNRIEELESLHPQYILYESDPDGAVPLQEIPGTDYEEIACITVPAHPDIAFALHLLKRRQ